MAVAGQERPGQPPGAVGGLGRRAGGGGQVGVPEGGLHPDRSSALVADRAGGGAGLSVGRPGRVPFAALLVAAPQPEGRARDQRGGGRGVGGHLGVGGAGRVQRAGRFGRDRLGVARQQLASAAVVVGGGGGALLDRSAEEVGPSVERRGRPRPEQSARQLHGDVAHRQGWCERAAENSSSAVAPAPTGSGRPRPAAPPRRCGSPRGALHRPGSRPGARALARRTAGRPRRCGPRPRPAPPAAAAGEDREREQGQDAPLLPPGLGVGGH